VQREEEVGAGDDVVEEVVGEPLGSGPVGTPREDTVKVELIDRTPARVGSERP
jgi:hypothetical protein